jgi:hypothetical protein
MAARTVTFDDLELRLDSKHSKMCHGQKIRDSKPTSTNARGSGRAFFLSMAARIKINRKCDLIQDGDEGDCLAPSDGLQRKSTRPSVTGEDHPSPEPVDAMPLEAEQLIAALKSWKNPTHRPMRPVRGQATITTHPSDTKGTVVVLHVADQVLVVHGGPELDRRLLELPLHHAQVEVVPGHSSTFYVTANTPDRAVDGIYVSVRDGLARDRWLWALAAMEVKVKGLHLVPGLSARETEPWFLDAGAWPLVRWLS